MRRVIINADDFGVNPIVTTETYRLMKAGLISSATILANGGSLNEVQKIYLELPNISFGIHLCLTEFQSLTRSSVFRKYGITDNNGIFIKKAIFNCQNYNDDLLSAVRAELEAQIETVLSLGIKISHADSHHLSHTSLYGFCDTFQTVLKEYGINKTRIGEKINIGEIIYHGMKKKIVKQSDQVQNSKNSLSQGIKPHRGISSRFLNLILKSKEQSHIIKAYKKNFQTTDHFASYNDFLYGKCRLPEGETIELMCHPGHPNPDYIKEISNIEQRKINSLIDYKLISYNEL